MWSVVTESPRHGERPRAHDVVDGRGLHADSVQERRSRDVGRCLVPCVAVTADGDGQSAPAVIAVKDLAVDASEDVGRDRVGNRLLDLLGSRPDVGQEDRRAIGVGSQRLVKQVDLHGPCQRERHDQRRRCEVAGSGQRVDAPFEVAVAGQHGRNHEVIVLDGCGDVDVEWPAVADARRAAVADDTEAELLERLQQAGPRVVLGYGARSRSEARLDRRPD